MRLSTVAVSAASLLSIPFKSTGSSNDGARSNAAAVSLAGTNSTKLCNTFMLTVSALEGSNLTYDGFKVIESGRSLYLSTSVPSGGEDGDVYATFFRNDSTHLFATGFTWYYQEVYGSPPFQLITLEDEGMSFFSVDPSYDEQYEDYTDNTYNVSNGTLQFTSTTGGPGGWYVCGANDATVWSIQMGVSSAAVAGCNRVDMLITDQTTTPTPQDVC